MIGGAGGGLDTLGALGPGAGDFGAGAAGLGGGGGGAGGLAFGGELFGLIGLVGLAGGGGGGGGGGFTTPGTTGGPGNNPPGNPGVGPPGGGGTGGTPGGGGGSAPVPEPSSIWMFLGATVCFVSLRFLKGLQAKSNQTNNLAYQQDACTRFGCKKGRTTELIVTQIVRQEVIVDDIKKEISTMIAIGDITLRPLSGAPKSIKRSIINLY